MSGPALGPVRGTSGLVVGVMFQVQRTKVQQYSPDEMAWAFDHGMLLRDEQRTPEPVLAIRWAMAQADAWRVFEEWSTLPAVWSGEQRVKILDAGATQ